MIYFSVGLITIPIIRAYYYRLLQVSSLEILYALTVTHSLGITSTLDVYLLALFMS
jgi:hypothetical protein